MYDYVTYSWSNPNDAHTKPSKWVLHHLHSRHVAPALSNTFFCLMIRANAVHCFPFILILAQRGGVSLHTTFSCLRSVIAAFPCVNPCLAPGSPFPCDAFGGQGFSFSCLCHEIMRFTYSCEVRCLQSLSLRYIL